jgi:hypothetical protein
LSLDGWGFPLSIRLTPTFFLSAPHEAMAHSLDDIAMVVIGDYVVLMTIEGEEMMFIIIAPEKSR